MSPPKAAVRVAEVVRFAVLSAYAVFVTAMPQRQPKLRLHERLQSVA
ncbi:hypothetical protein [Asticcacaulis sp.]